MRPYVVAYEMGPACRADICCRQGFQGCVIVCCTCVSLFGCRCVVEIAIIQSSSGWLTTGTAFSSKRDVDVFASGGGSSEGTAV